MKSPTQAYIEIAEGKGFKAVNAADYVYLSDKMFMVMEDDLIKVPPGWDGKVQRDDLFRLMVGDGRTEYVTYTWFLEHAGRILEVVNALPDNAQVIKVVTTEDYNKIKSITWAIPEKDLVIYDPEQFEISAYCLFGKGVVASRFPYEDRDILIDFSEGRGVQGIWKQACKDWITTAAINSKTDVDLTVGRWKNRKGNIGYELAAINKAGRHSIQYVNGNPSEIKTAKHHTKTKSLLEDIEMEKNNKEFELWKTWFTSASNTYSRMMPTFEQVKMNFDKKRKSVLSEPSDLKPLETELELD